MVLLHLLLHLLWRLHLLLLGGTASTGADLVVELLEDAELVLLEGTGCATPLLLLMLLLLLLLVA